MDGEGYEIEITQVIVQRVMKKDGKNVAAAETLIKSCCPSRFRTAFGVQGQELQDIVEEDADIREFIWPLKNEEDE